MRGNVRQLIESIIDVGSGLIIATLLQLYIFPFFGMYPTVWESFNIAVIFMCVSIFRSWLWRLFFRDKPIKKPKETTQKEWVKGYQEWKDHNLLLRRQHKTWAHVKEMVRRRYKEVK
jgi:hypothetical protein